MHGKWTENEDVTIVALRLGTNMSWERIKVEFDRVFPQASCKDLESRWNKSLRPTMPPGASRRIADVVDDYRHYRPSHIADGRERRLVLEVLRVLDGVSAERIIPAHPALESGDQGLQQAVVPPSFDSSPFVSAPPLQPTMVSQPAPTAPPGQLFLGEWPATDVAVPWDTRGSQSGLYGLEGVDDRIPLFGALIDPTIYQLEDALFVHQGLFPLPPLVPHYQQPQTYSPFVQLPAPALPSQPDEQGAGDPNIDPLLYEYQ